MDLSDATFAELKETLRTTAGLDRVQLVLCINEELYGTYAPDRYRNRRLATTDTVLSMSADLATSSTATSTLFAIISHTFPSLMRSHDRLDPTHVHARPCMIRCNVCTLLSATLVGC